MCEGMGHGTQPAQSTAPLSTLTCSAAGELTCALPRSCARRLAMRIGTRSVLYGAHCVLLHPWFVAFAWWRLNGFPWDARLWFAFWLHDAGYIGKPKLDGPEGETHVELGARVMGLLFGKSWGAFTAAHSRYWA